jgi:hypothetical protein
MVEDTIQEQQGILNGLVEDAVGMSQAASFREAASIDRS